MEVSDGGFGMMALRCLRLARGLCDERLAFILEGGYDRGATARSVEAVLRAIVSEDAPPIGTEELHAAAAIARARETQAAYWDL
jgi:acetoin utilization deacetylase AcuC-like enzyme